MWCSSKLSSLSLSIFCKCQSVHARGLQGKLSRWTQARSTRTVVRLGSRRVRHARSSLEVSGCGVAYGEQETQARFADLPVSCVFPARQFRLLDKRCESREGAASYVRTSLRRSALWLFSFFAGTQCLTHFAWNRPRISCFLWKSARLAFYGWSFVEGKRFTIEKLAKKLVFLQHAQRVFFSVLSCWLFQSFLCKIRFCLAKCVFEFHSSFFAFLQNRFNLVVFNKNLNLNWSQQSATRQVHLQGRIHHFIWDSPASWCEISYAEPKKKLNQGKSIGAHMNFITNLIANFVLLWSTFNPKQEKRTKSS